MKRKDGKIPTSRGRRSATQKRGTELNRATVLLAYGALSVLAACAPPFAMKRNVLGAQRQAAANVLVTGEISRRTDNVLYEHDLVARYADDPVGALAELHGELVRNQLRPESVIALAEVAFHHARYGGGGRPYYLASALSLLHLVETPADTGAR